MVELMFGQRSDFVIFDASQKVSAPHFPLNRAPDGCFSKTREAGDRQSNNFGNIQTNFKLELLTLSIQFPSLQLIN